MGADVVLAARGLVLGYGSRVVLRDVALTVHAGEFWFLLGPNGEGKTTLVRAILGVLPPLAGALVLHPGLGDRAHVGFVPQRCDLNPALPTTVREFVLLGAVGVPRAGEAERVAWALERVGLDDKARRDFHALSGGERQRALVARALVRKPRFLVLDEPTNHLDPGAEIALLDLLEALHRDDGLTIMVVTHDLTMAAAHATHLALVQGGRVESGPRERLWRAATLAHVFGVTVPGVPA